MTRRLHDPARSTTWRALAYFGVLASLAAVLLVLAMAARTSTTTPERDDPTDSELLIEFYRELAELRDADTVGYCNALLFLDESTNVGECIREEVERQVDG